MKILIFPGHGSQGSPLEDGVQSVNGSILSCSRSFRPIFSVLADSDEESSSAGSSDEEELLLSESQGPVGEKGSTAAADG